MHANIVRLELAALLLLSAVGCPGATAPQVDDVLKHRAIWVAQHLSNYSYEYEQTGFFNNRAGRVIRLEVRADTVRSAVFVSTGEPVPGAPAEFPTVDSLFAQAGLALQNHTLTAIVFDPQLGYPLRMDLAGPPDASGSIIAGQLHALP